MAKVQNTATATLGLGIVVDVVDWVLGDFKGPPPSAAIAALLIPVGHLVWNYLQAKLAIKIDPVA